MSQIFDYSEMLKTYPDFDIKTWENARSASDDTLAFHLDVTGKDGTRQVSTLLYARGAEIDDSQCAATLEQLKTLGFTNDAEHQSVQERNVHGCIRAIAALHHHFPREATTRTPRYFATLHHLDPSLDVIAAKLVYDRERDEMTCDTTSAFRTRHARLH